AETRSGDFHLGAGAAWFVPLNTGVREQRQGLATSLEVMWEWDRATIGFTVVNAPGVKINPSPDELTAGTPWDLFAVHAAWMPWSWGSTSFYAGGGLGLMLAGFRMTDEEFPGSPFFHWDSGGALLAETGLLLFRGARWGRLS